MSDFTRAVLFVCVVSTISACATKSLSDYPLSDEQFSVQPSELQAQYSDVERYSPSLNGVKLGDKDSYKTVVANWGEPDKIKNTKPERFVDTGIGLMIAAAPIFTLVPNPVFIPVVAGIIGAEIGLLYLIMPDENRSTWDKGDYRIEVMSAGKPGERQFGFWEWSHKEADCDCYQPLLSKRKPTAMFIDLAFGASFSDVYINDFKLQHDPKFTFSFNPGINYSMQSPYKVNLSAALDVSRQYYNTEPNVSFSAIEQVGLRLAFDKPVALDDRLSVGAGFSMPFVSRMIDENEVRYKLSDDFPRLFLQLNYMAMHNSEIGYVISYDKLDWNTGDNLKINELSFGTSWKIFF